MTIICRFDRTSNVSKSPIRWGSRKYIMPMLLVAERVSVAKRGDWDDAGLTGARIMEPEANEVIYILSHKCGGWVKPAQVRLGAGIRKEDVEEVLGRKLIKPSEAESTTKRGAWVPKNGWLLG